MKNLAKVVLLLTTVLIFTNNNSLLGQTTRFPNVTKDNTASRSLIGVLGIDNVLTGYTALTLEGTLIEKNKYYLRLNAGAGIVYNLKYSDDDGFDHKWWSPVGALEIGYPFSLGVKSKEGKFVTSQGYVAGPDPNKNYFQRNFYATQVPLRFLLTPVVALNYEPLPFVLRTFDGGVEGTFTQRLLTLNMGVKLIKWVNADLIFKDKESGATLTGNGERYSCLYFGIDIPLKAEYETHPDYTNIFKSDRPTFETYISFPSNFLNSVAYFDIGIKSLPYVRKDRFAPGSNQKQISSTGGTYQLYFAYKFYL